MSLSVLLCCNDVSRGDTCIIIRLIKVPDLLSEDGGSALSIFTILDWLSSVLSLLLYKESYFYRCYSVSNAEPLRTY